jgi:hypothetical protein
MRNHNKKPRSDQSIDLGFFVAVLQMKSPMIQFDSPLFFCWKKRFVKSLKIRFPP